MTIMLGSSHRLFITLRAGHSAHAECRHCDFTVEGSAQEVMEAVRAHRRENATVR